MKKTTRIDDLDDDLKPEYDFDYAKSKPNKFAQKLKEQDRYIQLEPDVYKIFKNSNDVNNALRSLINAIPRKREAKVI